MAEGRSNAAIAARMFVTEKAVGKHTNNISPNWACSSPRTTTEGVLAVLNISTAEPRVFTVRPSERGPELLERSRADH